MTALGSEDSVEFLRRSLTDLDAELAAGDLAPDDHRRLRDEYTARLARALRNDAADAPPAAPEPQQRRRGRGRGALWAAGVVVLAVVAGVAVARTSGTRTSGQELSGGGRDTARERLDGCLQLFAEGQALEAVRCYDGVLADEPSSAEAHTYRGWTLVRIGDERLWPAAGRALDQAVALDPTYPDARVFRAVLRRDEGRTDEARADLVAFDGLDAPPMMRQLVDRLGLRQSLAATPGTAAATSTTAPVTPTTAASPTTSSGG